jgi:hypothetical protein
MPDNINNNNNNNIDLQSEIKRTESITMNLENLQKEYSNLLISYQQAITNYVNYTQLTQPNYNINGEPYVSIQGQSYSGTGSAGTSQATTLQDCIASCSSSENCTGATFVSNQCLLRTGDSAIVPSTQNSYAIVPTSVKLLLDIENINQQLITVNQKITAVMKNADPVYNSQVSDRLEEQKKLIKNYEELIEERDKIVNLLREYETLDNTSLNDQITINQRFYAYVLLSILAIVVIFLLYKLSYSSKTVSTPTTVQYGGDLGISAYYVLFVIILIIVFIKYYKN